MFGTTVLAAPLRAGSAACRFRSSTRRPAPSRSRGLALPPTITVLPAAASVARAAQPGGMATPITIHACYSLSAKSGRIRTPYAGSRPPAAHAPSASSLSTAKRRRGLTASTSGGEPPGDVPVAPDQELLKIPQHLAGRVGRDPVAPQPRPHRAFADRLRASVDQDAVERMLLLPRDADLTEEGGKRTL